MPEALQKNILEDNERLVVEVKPEPAATGLRSADPGQAKFANHLASLFIQSYPSDEKNDAQIRSAKILWPVKLPDSSINGGITYTDKKGLYFQPVGNTAELINKDNNLDIIIRLLDKFEPVIQQFELRTGLAFEPADTVNDYISGAIWLEIAVVFDSEEKCLSARFGFAPERQILALLPKLQGNLSLANLPVSMQLTMIGPSLSIEDAAGISPGDLLLLPAPICPVKINIDHAFFNGELRISGSWNVSSGQFRYGQIPEQIKSEIQGAMSMESDETSGLQGNGDDENANERSAISMKVPVSIMLADQPIAASKLNQLTEGSTLDLMPLSEGLQVELKVAGQSIASGEVVKLGDRFAVLVDHLIAHSAPAQISFAEEN